MISVLRYHVTEVKVFCGHGALYPSDFSALALRLKCSAFQLLPPFMAVDAASKIFVFSETSLFLNLLI